MSFSKLKMVLNTKREIREALNNVNGLSKRIINRVARRATIESSNDIIIINDPYAFDDMCVLRHKSFDNYELEEKGTCLYGNVIFGSWLEDNISKYIVNSEFEVNDIHIVEISTYGYNNGEKVYKRKMYVYARD